MKVYELLSEELSKPIQNLSISNKSLNKEPTSLKWSRVGKPGQQATAYQHQEQLHKNSVIKNLFVFGNEDPAYQFLRLCKNQQQNPHFPKIYKVKQYPLETGGYNLTITMEKLLPIPDDSLLLQELFGLSYGALEIKNIDHVLYLFDEPEVRQQIMNETKLPSLKQAMRLMEPLFRHYVQDMHGGNIMYRKTPRGPVLVFLDPVQ